MDESLHLLIGGFLIGVIISGLITHDITKENMQKKAVDLGVAEFYFNQDYEPQFRYKEAK